MGFPKDFYGERQPPLIKSKVLTRMTARDLVSGTHCPKGMLFMGTMEMFLQTITITTKKMSPS